MLIDQKYNEGINVPLLGRPAMSGAAYAQLAQRFACPLVPYTGRTPGRGKRFRITAHPAIPLQDAGRRAATGGR